MNTDCLVTRSTPTSQGLFKQNELKFCEKGKIMEKTKKKDKIVGCQLQHYFF